MYELGLDITTAALGGLALSAFYVIATLVYRLFLHPLARFPGPKLAAATKWYEFSYDVNLSGGGQYAKRIDEMHEQYGPVIRITPEEIHIRDPSFYENVYGGPGSVRHKYAPAASMAGTNQGTFGTVQHHIHRHRRQAVVATFQPQALAALEPLIRGKVGEFINFISNEQAREGTVELKRAFLAMTTDLVSNYALGESSRMLQNPDKAHGWFRTINAVAEVTTLLKQFPWLISVLKSVPRPWVRYFLPDLVRVLDLHMDMRALGQTNIDALALEPDAKLSSRSTIIQRILLSKLPEEEKSVTRLQHESVIMITAGSETTARTLTTATFFVLENKAILQRLQAELSKAIPNADEIPPLRELEQLPYLTAVLKEALRMAAATTSRLPIVLDEVLAYEGWEIPPNTPVSLTIYTTLTDPKLYPEPLRFNPDRWLEDTPTSQLANKLFVPFGKGPRSCMGFRLAWVMMYLTMATVFRQKHLELYDTLRERDIDPVRDCFVGMPTLGSKGVRARVLDGMQGE